MNRGQAASQTSYQPYTGQRVADFTGLQNQAFENVGNMGVSPLMGQGAGMAGMAGIGGLNAGNNYMQQATSPQAMQSYMSPYMQNVVDWQKNQAVQDYNRGLPSIGAGASKAGAFGGTRHALVESEANRNLQNQLAGIQATGTQNAFDQAQKSLQFGTTAGLQGLQTAGQAAGTLGQLGQSSYNQQMGINQAQQQAGGIQQAQAQQGIDQKYEEFMRQQQYPWTQLQNLSSLLRGSVVSPNQTMYSYQQQPNIASQIGGLGLGALGLSKAFKEGGAVKKFAIGGEVGSEGGLASNVSKLIKVALSSPNPQQVISQANATPLEKMMATQKVQQMRQSSQNYQALQAGEPQGTVLGGIAGMDTGVMESADYAGGGIVAFDDGGGVGMLGGIAKFFKDAYNRPRTYATPAEEERAKRLQAIAEQRAQAQQAPVAPGGIAAFSANEPEPTVYAKPTTPQIAPTPQPAPTAQAASTVRAPQLSAKGPDLSSITKSLQTERDNLGTAEDATTARRDALRKEIPDDIKERLDMFKEEAKTAVQDRDKDRWLAVAMGGFAAAAGTSPYMLKNFAEGLGLTTKELGSINKDFRNAERERNKLVLAEKRLDRAERMGIEKDAIAAGDRVRTARDAYNKAIATTELKVAELGEKRFETVAKIGAEDRRTAAVAEGNRTQRDSLNYVRQQDADTKRARVLAAIQDKVRDRYPMYTALQQKAAAGKIKPEEQVQLDNIGKLIQSETAKAMAGAVPSGDTGGKTDVVNFADLPN